MPSEPCRDELKLEIGEKKFVNTRMGRRGRRETGRELTDSNCPVFQTAHVGEGSRSRHGDIPSRGWRRPRKREKQQDK